MRPNENTAVMREFRLDNSVAPFLSGPLVIRETVYGIVKRLNFFIQQIEAYRKERDLEPHEVRVLDVGCGTGVNVTLPLSNAGYSVIGLDLDSASIDRARQLAQGLRNIDFRVGSVENQRFSEPFHVIICSEVLEHQQAPTTLVQQILVVLIEEGLLLVTVPNGFGYFELESLFWRIFYQHPRLLEKLYRCERLFWKLFGSANIRERRRYEYDPKRLELTSSTLAPDTTHYQSFTYSRITRLLQSQGLKVLTVRNNTFLAGNLLSLAVQELDSFLAWNARAADGLPAFMVSGWLIAAEKSIA